MDSAELLKVYYSQLDDFLVQLIELYPNNINIKKYKEYIQISKKIKPRFIIEKLFEYVSPHKDLLLEKNENYFLEMKYGENEGGDDATIMYALDLKTLWENSSDSTKESIFNYLILFYKMGEKIL